MKKRRKSRVVRKKRTDRRTRDVHAWDWWLFAITLVLLIIGVIMVFEASIIEAYRTFGDQLYFAKRQLQWSLIGLVGLSVAAIVPVKWYRQLAFPALIVTVILLLLVLIPGLGLRVGGAKRWLDFGVFSVQPAEVAKLGLILYFSALFEKTPKIGQFLGSLGVVVVLIMLQPDLGTTIMIAGISTLLFFLAGAPLSYFFTIIVSGLTLGSLLILSSPYRRARLFTFLDPQNDPLGTSYHIRQIIIALGSGGIFGTGIGRSLQKYQYLPEATTDSIFAVIAEETGFMGTLIVVGLFTMFAYRGFKIASHAPNTFYSLVATGITVLIVSQAFLNLSAMAALVPLTGITLPFISYGGSSLVISLLSVGVLLNISRYTQTNESRKKR